MSWIFCCLCYINQYSSHDSCDIFSGDAIASEFEHRTGHILFPNLVKRTTIVTGKYLACIIAMVSIIIIGYGTSPISLLIFYGELPLDILASMPIALIIGCSVISLAFLSSFILDGSMGATVTTPIAYLVIFSIIPVSLTYSGYEPWCMPDREGDALTSTFDVPFRNLAGGFEQGPMSGMLEASADPSISFIVLTIYASFCFS